MTQNYNQWKAAFALAKASLLAMLRSPTSVVFSILFPIIFIVVFGSMVDNSQVNIKVGIAPGCDTANIVYKVISSVKIIRPQTTLSMEKMMDNLQKGQITAIINVRNDAPLSPFPHYKVTLVTSNSALSKLKLLESVINEAVSNMNERMFPKNPSTAKITVTTIPGRLYRQIDFILPGQLGFSLLMAGVFGSSFLLFGLRQNHVLKRFFATPVSRGYLIAGELFSRLFFQVIGFCIMVALGYFVFDFTLINGIFTFLEMLLLSVIALIIFTGIGFIISGIIQNESSIAPVANTITLPQILLCGLFFPIDSYPHWLETCCKILPLTFFVDGLRKIAFEGLHFWQIPVELGGLIIWAIIIGFITVKAFRWE
ncbi:MAG TPA: ABC transporter permease [Puia sp.]|nr:ABC transporter permease [Puia sp.]